MGPCHCRNPLIPTHLAHTHVHTCTPPSSSGSKAHNIPSSAASVVPTQNDPPPKMTPHPNYGHPAGARIRGAETSAELSFLLERSPGETKFSTTLQLARPSENPKPCAVFRNALSSSHSLHIVEASNCILYLVLSVIFIVWSSWETKTKKAKAKSEEGLYTFRPIVTGISPSFQLKSI